MNGNYQIMYGDATNPIGDKNNTKFIIHCCNDIGAWGAGFVMALNNRWDTPVKEYMRWANSNDNTFHLGEIQCVEVEPNLSVINMIGQHSIGCNEYGYPAIRYYAIDMCLIKVAELAKKYNASIHAPKFGSALAGGKWEYIELMIQKRLIDLDIDVTVYDFIV